jgi:ubiquitin-conjugating enzyme E2 T
LLECSDALLLSNLIIQDIRGPTDSPFEDGTFKLDVQIPQRYPFDPPQIRFVTPIYHPNIDEAGRICADILKMPPAGSWKPALNLSTVLLALAGLMSYPNPDDPLEVDIVRFSWCYSFLCVDAY